MVIKNTTSMMNLNTSLDRLLENELIQKKDFEDIQKTVEFIASLYCNKKRRHESCFLYEHPVNVAANMVDTYFKRLDSGDDFVRIFRKKPKEFIYTGLFHDAIEDKVLDATSLYNFLKDELRLDAKEVLNIVINVDALSKDWKKGSRKEYLGGLKKKEVAKYVKCFDILDNSKDIHLHRGSYQHNKIMDDYLPFTQEIYPYVAQQVEAYAYKKDPAEFFIYSLVRPLCNNLKKTSATIRAYLL